MLFWFQVNETENIYYFNGTYQGLNRIMCPLPSPQPLIELANLLTYHISVTRNGDDYGPGKSMRVYDGSCIECTNVSGCQIKVSLVFLEIK